MIERRKILDGWARIHNDWIIVRNGKSKTFSFNLNLYSGQELRDRLERAGFVIEYRSSDLRVLPPTDADGYIYGFREGSAVSA